MHTVYNACDAYTMHTQCMYDTYTICYTHAIELLCHSYLTDVESSEGPRQRLEISVAHLIHNIHMEADYSLEVLSMQRNGIMHVRPIYYTMYIRRIYDP